MWFGTNHGIIKKQNSNWQRFTTKDGLIGDEININTFSVDEYNNLWFGSVDGLCRYNPQQDVSSNSARLHEVAFLR